MRPAVGWSTAGWESRTASERSRSNHDASKIFTFLRTTELTARNLYFLWWYKRFSCGSFCDRIAITTKGKYTALEAEAVDALALLVDDEISEVRLNAIKVRKHDCHKGNTETETTLQRHPLMIEKRKKRDDFNKNACQHKNPRESPGGRQLGLT